MTDAKFLGIDGGGSSTRAFVVDNDLGLVGTRRGGPSNVLVVGEARADVALSSVLSRDERYTAIVAGIAGADRPWVRAFWESRLSPYADQLWVMGDYRIAWAALTDGSPGLVAIFGTGSVFYAEGKARQVRLGGYGWKVGDIGSGIMLGQAAVSAALGELEGWGPQTALTRPVLAWAQAENRAQLLNYIYHPDVDWRSVSDLAVEVFRAADAGDDPASAILEDQAQLIQQYLLAAETEAEVPVDGQWGLAGGLARLWLPRLKREAVRPLQLVEREPGLGAARLAKKYFDKGQEGISH